MNAQITEIKDIAAAITALTADLNAKEEARDAELKAHGEASKATTEAVESVKTELDGVKVELKKATDKLVEFEVKAGRLGRGGVAEEPSSAGAAFLKSDAYEGARQVQFKGASRPFRLKSFFATKADEVGVVTTEDDSAGLSTDYQRVPGLVEDPQRPMTLRQVLTVGRTTSDSIRYVQEKGFYNLVAQVTSAAGASATEVEISNVTGFYDGQIVVVKGAEKQLAASNAVDRDASTITFSAAIGVAVAEGDEITSDTFVFTPETQLKPRATMDVESVTVQVKTLATGMVLTTQILADAPMLRAHVDNRMMQSLKIQEERQILYGDGSDDQFLGLANTPDVQSYNWSDGASGDTKVDAIRRAITLGTLAELPANTLVMNPLDWQDIELSKDANGQYLYTAAGALRSATIFGLRIVVTTAVEPGDFFLGAFGDAVQLWDREQANIQLFDQHKDLAERNMVYLRAEERLALAIPRPEAIVFGKFDAAP